MAELLRSVGLDVGTSTTQMVVSRLTVENKASAFSVPEMEIARREILYKSPIHITPLLGQDLVDGNGIRRIVEQEYRDAGISRADVDSGAVIITGETSRKENARAVLNALSQWAGDFVVATAGPHLESVLAAKGSGADRYSAETGKTVLHMDIGGGTSNLALIENGEITATGCMNVGGRLLKFDSTGRITYRSPVLRGLFTPQLGEIPSQKQLRQLCRTLAQGLEMAAGLSPATGLLTSLWTAEAGEPWIPLQVAPVLSFSGGVAACMEQRLEPLAFGDIGVYLGQAIRESRLCRGEYRLGSETIRATVIGAGCPSTQLSGSTVFHRGISFPLKNIPVVSLSDAEQKSPSLSQLLAQKLGQQDTAAVIALPGFFGGHYSQITALADAIAAASCFPVMVALQADMAKALGHALSLRLPKDIPILCIDRVKLSGESFLDVGFPVGNALPVVIKTLILEK